MTTDIVDSMIRQAIGGDPAAVAWIVDHAGASDATPVIVMAALVTGDPSGLERAGLTATTQRDRQLTAIAAAHLRGEHELVDALARDHLSDYPDSLIVAWIAAATGRDRYG